MTEYKLWARHPVTGIWANLGEPSENAAGLYHQARQFAADPENEGRYDRLAVWQARCAYADCDGQAGPATATESTGYCPKCERYS